MKKCIMLGVMVLSLLGVSLGVLVGTAHAECNNPDTPEDGACYVIPVWALGPDQNKIPANFIPQLVGDWFGYDIVSRDHNNNFFLNDRHLELPEFWKLRINADLVLPGVRVLLSSVVVK